MQQFVGGMILLSALAGCAAFDRPAQFSLDDYPGSTPLERTLARVNLEQNRAHSCGAGALCQLSMPSREELAAANFYDCKAYVMSKAYALEDAGIDASRMRVALFRFATGSHVVLVVDERYVLDNIDGSVRQLREYSNFQPMLANLPPTLMARSPARLRLASWDAASGVYTSEHGDRPE